MAKIYVKEFYVGMASGRTDSNTVLSFMTPNRTKEKDAAFEKRKITVDNWAGRNGIPAIIIGNDYLGGYRVAEHADHTGGRYGGTIKWRIEHPQGFTVEISSANLQHVMEHSAIDAGGYILRQCRWARDGANNYLVVKGSPLDLFLSANESMIESGDDKKSSDDLTIGDVVTFTDGDDKEYVFVGVRYFCTINKNTMKVKAAKKSVFVSEHRHYSGGAYYRAMAKTGTMSIRSHKPCAADFDISPYVRCVEETYPSATTDTNYSKTAIARITPKNDRRYYSSRMVIGAVTGDDRYWYIDNSYLRWDQPNSAYRRCILLDQEALKVGIVRPDGSGSSAHRMVANLYVVERVVTFSDGREFAQMSEYDENA